MLRQGWRLAVIGAARSDDRLGRLAFETGRLVAESGAILLCGGRGGVMEAAARGASEAGGVTVGILPGASAESSPPNRWIQIPIFTGIGQARNQVLVLSADAVLGIGGGWGTLSEIGLALKHSVPVVLQESWSLERPDGLAEGLLAHAANPAEALATARRLCDLQDPVER